VLSIKSKNVPLYFIYYLPIFKLISNRFNFKEIIHVFTKKPKNIQKFPQNSRKIKYRITQTIKKAISYRIHFFEEKIFNIFRRNL
jgi:hypothetical protein